MTAYPPAHDNAAYGGGVPYTDNNTNSDAIAACQQILAAWAGFPGNVSIPGSNTTNATNMATLVGSNFISPGLAPSNDATGATDKTNITALWTLGAGRIQLLPGQYYVTTLSPPSHSRLTGCGAGITTITAVGGAMFNVGQASQLDTFELDHLSLTAASGYDILSGAYAARLYVHDNLFTQNGSSNSIWNGTCTSGQSVVECRFRRNQYYVYGGTRTVPAFFLSGGSATQINGNSWRDDVVFNAGDDTAQYIWHIQNTGGLNETNSWRDIVCEHPYGGMIWLESATGSLIENVAAYDVPNTFTISNSLIYISKNSGGSASGRNRISGAIRIQGTVAWAANTGDIYLDANCYATTITAPDATGNLVMYLNGSKVKLIGMPDGGWGIQDSAFTVAAGANAGSSAPAPVNSLQPDVTSGTVTFGTGTGSAAGVLVNVTYGCPLQETCEVMVVPYNAATAALSIFPTSPTATGFTLSTANAPTDSKANTFYGFRWSVSSG